MEVVYGGRYHDYTSFTAKLTLNSYLKSNFSTNQICYLILGSAENNISLKTIIYDDDFYTYLTLTKQGSKTDGFRQDDVQIKLSTNDYHSNNTFESIEIKWDVHEYNILINNSRISRVKNVCKGYAVYVGVGLTYNRLTTYIVENALKPNTYFLPKPDFSVKCDGIERNKGPDFVFNDGRTKLVNNGISDPNKFLSYTNMNIDNLKEVLFEPNQPDNKEVIPNEQVIRSYATVDIVDKNFIWVLLKRPIFFDERCDVVFQFWFGYRNYFELVSVTRRNNIFYLEAWRKTETSHEKVRELLQTTNWEDIFPITWFYSENELMAFLVCRSGKAWFENSAELTGDVHYGYEFQFETKLNSYSINNFRNPNLRDTVFVNKQHPIKYKRTASLFGQLPLLVIGRESFDTTNTVSISDYAIEPIDSNEIVEKDILTDNGKDNDTTEIKKEDKVVEIKEMNGRSVDNTNNFKKFTPEFVSTEWDGVVTEIQRELKTDINTTRLLIMGLAVRFGTSMESVRNRFSILVLSIDNRRFVLNHGDIVKRFFKNFERNNFRLFCRKNCGYTIRNIESGRIPCNYQNVAKYNIPIEFKHLAIDFIDLNEFEFLTNDEFEVASRILNYPKVFQKRRFYLQ